MRLAPSLHRVGFDQVNVYLVEDPTGITIVDAGLPGHYDEVVSELALMGRSLDDVRGVVLTHGDTDHIGFAEQLRVERGIRVYVHQLDVARARGEVKKHLKWGKVKAGPLLGFLWYSARRGGFSIRPVTEVVTFTDGETLDLPGAPRVIHVPGHTPGSVAIHVPEVDAVFVGDAMTTGHVLTGAQGPGPAPFTLDPNRALASLSRLEKLPATWVLPGHGAPFDGGVAEAVRRVMEVVSATGGDTGDDDLA
ncbi:MAG TPA: MBL fold metallo-hydrolase [Acidimicrobiia bacterium]